MPKIKVLVDTGSDIPKYFLEKYDISVVPLTVHINNENKQDYFELDPVEFCKHLRVCQEAPRTSQPSPMDFVDYFNKFSKEYEHIICLTMAPAGSGTYNSACLGKGMFDDEHSDGSCQVHVIDSKSCSLAEVMQARAAGDLIEQGADIETILAKLDDIRFNITTYYLVDNIDFLIRGGRVSVLKGAIANKLNLKPIVCIKNGEGSIIGNAMGYRKGIDKLVSFYKAEAKEGACLYVSHSDCEDKAMQFVEKFKSQFPDIECIVTQMFCTMATQAGPDTVAAIYEMKH